MNQTNGNLSPEQFAALQALFIFLESATAILDAQTMTTGTDKEVTNTVLLLGQYCKDRMLSAFPEFAEWRALGDGVGHAK